VHREALEVRRIAQGVEDLSPERGHARLERRAYGEARCLTIGMSHRQRLVVVAHANRDNAVRLINARAATWAPARAMEVAGSSHWAAIFADISGSLSHL